MYMPMEGGDFLSVDCAVLKSKMATRGDRNM